MPCTGPMKGLILIFASVSSSNTCIPFSGIAAWGEMCASHHSRNRRSLKLAVFYSEFLPRLPQPQPGSAAPRAGRVVLT